MSESCTKNKRLAIAEREEIAILHKLGKSIAQIAITIDRARSTISRELKRGAYKTKYRANIAQNRADALKRLRKKLCKSNNAELLHKIERMLRHYWSPKYSPYVGSYCQPHHDLYDYQDCTQGMV